MVFFGYGIGGRCRGWECPLFYNFLPLLLFLDWIFLLCIFSFFLNMFFYFLFFYLFISLVVFFLFKIVVSSDME